MGSSVGAVKDSLRGVCVGLLTPFDEDGNIEHEKLHENARSIYDQGIRTFLSAANISEYHSLSQAERIDVVRTGVDALPDDACVLAGAGGNIADAHALIEQYEEIGVDVIMVMPPEHTYIHEQALLDYYRELVSVTDRPIVPYVRRVNPSAEYLAELTRIDGVVGIKYALEDPVKLGAGIAHGSDDVIWIDGLAEPYAVSYWAEGVEGFSAGVSNFRPEVGLALYDALVAENWERARTLRNVCIPYQWFRNGTGEKNQIPGAISVSAVKKGLELAGLHGGSVRKPIRSLTNQEERRAERLYAELDAEIDRLID